MYPSLSEHRNKGLFLSQDNQTHFKKYFSLGKTAIGLASLYQELTAYLPITYLS